MENGNLVFAERFVQALKTSKVMQKDLAKILNISPSNITNYKKGKYIPSSFSGIAKIARALNVSAPWLAGLTDDENIYPLTERDMLRNKVEFLLDEMDEEAMKKVIRFIEDFL